MERFIDAGRGLEKPPYLALQKGRSFATFSTAAGSVLAGTQRQLEAVLPGLPAIAGGLASFAAGRAAIRRLSYTPGPSNLRR